MLRPRLSVCVCVAVHCIKYQVDSIELEDNAYVASRVAGEQGNTTLSRPFS